jgi:protein involved in polysaccharide export with SLBB domain
VATFLFLGDLQVVGLTIDDLNRKLADAYRTKDEVGAGNVTANLAEAAPREVVVIGEVHDPGVVAFGRGPLTLLEAIGRAGGPVKGSALLAETMLIRWSTTKQSQQVWHFDARRSEWQTGASLLLQPHDVVFVPNNTIDRINVWVDKYIRQNLPLPLGIPVQ